MLSAWLPKFVYSARPETVRRRISWANSRLRAWHPAAIRAASQTGAGSLATGESASRRSVRDKAPDAGAAGRAADVPRAATVRARAIGLVPRSSVAVSWLFVTSIFT